MYHGLTAWWTDAEGVARWELLANDGVYEIYLLVVVVWAFDAISVSV